MPLSPPAVLVVHDLFEESDEDIPPSLLSLEAWLDKERAGVAPYEVDRNEGVGVWFSDGTHDWLQTAFGEPRAMAGNCEAAAQRLGGGHLALMRTAILDVASYLWLVPDGDVVRMVMPREKPDLDAAANGGLQHPFPFRPSRQADTEEGVAALYAWAEAHAQRLMAPSGNPALDRRQGKELRLPRTSLVAALSRQAEVARQAADALARQG